MTISELKKLPSMNFLSIQFNTNILLTDDNGKSSWLDELGYEQEDCGVFLPIPVDSMDYKNGDMNGRLNINGIDYSFDLNGIFENDHDFDESPLCYILDYVRVPDLDCVVRIKSLPTVK